MIKELQLRLDPRTAHFIDAVEEVVAKQEGIMRRRLHGVRIIKRSIDARQRRVMVNLKVRAYIDQPMTADYLVPPINYCPVKGNRQAIVVGAGPGGLFAALRLIELGIKPIVLERGKNVRDRRLDVAAISRKGIVARVGQVLTVTVSFTLAAANVARWSAFSASFISMVPARTFSSMLILTLVATSCLASSRTCATLSSTVVVRCVL